MADNKSWVRTPSGKMVRMNEAALRLAEKKFGVNVTRQRTKEVPIELLRVPFKPEIIKATEKQTIDIKTTDTNVSVTAEVQEIVNEDRPSNPAKPKGRTKK